MSSHAVTEQEERHANGWFMHVKCKEKLKKKSNPHTFKGGCREMSGFYIPTRRDHTIYPAANYKVY